MSLLVRNGLLLLGVVALTVLSLGLPSWISGGEAAFEGADRRAAGLAQELHPDYKPLAKPIWEPPSGEVESLIFSLQASAGVGFIAYFIGHRKALANLRKQES
ncbi:MAG: energy-coupling factor ABC transporter substrate-binding protein [Bacillota bacterium]